jgi:quercetin dioxygenase-like cupin family protein
MHQEDDSTVISPDAGRFRVARDGDTRVARSDHFIGHVVIEAFGAALGSDQITVHAVTFFDGARTRPHMHVGDLVLYFVNGPGVVSVDGGDEVVVAPGTFVLLPAGVVHMHGGQKGANVLQLAIESDHGVTFDIECPEAWLKFVFPQPG